MDFNEGDRLVGAAGTERTRDAAGRWWTDRRAHSVGDDTARWCLDVDVVAPEAPPGPAGKLSKTEPPPPPARRVYRWRLVPAA